MSCGILTLAARSVTDSPAALAFLVALHLVFLAMFLSTFVLDKQRNR